MSRRTNSGMVVCTGVSQKGVLGAIVQPLSHCDRKTNIDPAEVLCTASAPTATSGYFSLSDVFSGQSD